MNEELAREILSRLDIASENIGEWGTTALTQYCGSQAVYHIVVTIALGVLAVVLLTACVLCVVTMYRKGDNDDYYAAHLFIAEFAGIIGLIILVIFVVALVHAIQWSLYPDGMIMQELLGCCDD